MTMFFVIVAILSISSCSAADNEHANRPPTCALEHEGANSGLVGRSVLQREYVHLGMGAKGSTAAETTVSQTSAIPSQMQKDAIVRKHNELRKALGASDMTKMSWDDTLGTAAQQWASTCTSGHSTDRANHVGENMAWKWSAGFQLTDNTDVTPSIQKWYDEMDGAGPYQSGGIFEGFGSCTKPGSCGHYTQVVWAAANKIGCGVASCPHSSGMPGYVFVCQYGSSVAGGYGGNMAGETLFTMGSACSNCPSGFQICSDSLCSSESNQAPVAHMQNSSETQKHNGANQSRHAADLRRMHSEIQALDQVVKHRKEEAEVKRLEYQKAQDEAVKAELELELASVMKTAEEPKAGSLSLLGLGTRSGPSPHGSTHEHRFHPKFRTDIIKEIEALEDADWEAHKTEAFVQNEERTIKERHLESPAFHKHQSRKP